MHNAIRNLSLSLLLSAGVCAPAAAQISINLISIAPPAPQHEVVPAVAPGYVWAPGYWGWSGERHVWIRGRPIAQREGFRWDADRWDQRDGRYERVAGHWVRDENFRPGKPKKEKKHEDRDEDGRGEHHDNGKHLGRDKRD